MHDISRHRRIFDPKQHERPVVLAGCGATGSHVALQLASLGVRNMLLVDFDLVEGHNLCNQIYHKRDVGSYKTEALNSLLKKKFGGKGFSILNGRLPETPIESDYTNPVMILCVDSMRSRGEIVTALHSADWHIIDTRMGMTHGNILSFNISERDKWYETLINDDEAEAPVCGASSSVLPTVQFTASLAVWEYIKLCTDPDAMVNRIDYFLKPTALSGRSFSR